MTTLKSSKAVVPLPPPLAGGMFRISTTPNSITITTLIKEGKTLGSLSYMYDIVEKNGQWYYYQI